MANRDVDVRSDTWTRSQLLAERGYPEEIIAGNGHAGNGKVTPATTARESAAGTPTGPDAGARTCSECGKPVAAGRRYTCSSTCAEARDRRQELERKRARRSTSVERRAHVAPRKTVPTPAASPGPEPATDAPAELVTIAPPAELEADATSYHTDATSPPAELKAGGVAVSLADELEECAGLLRRIARRLVG